MGETFPYLIDWLTMRLPVSPTTHPAIFDRVAQYAGHLVSTDCNGEIKWIKRNLDIESLRSDSPGLFWQLTGDGKTDVLAIGASPASIEHGLNIWGSIDIQHCADVLISCASRSLSMLLPSRDSWQARRIDVTANYALPDPASVKSALSQLLVSSGARRRTSSHNRGGDTVYWNLNSDRAKGKAYHKGPQVMNLWKKNRIQNLPEQVDLLDQIIRLEHTRGARWFRELERAGIRWQDLSPEYLIALHTEFFAPLVGHGIEVKNMEKTQIVKTIMQQNYCTENQAVAAFNTYRNCRIDGYEVTRSTVPRATFYRHLKLLKVAGISDSHLRTASIIPFPKIRFDLARPVGCWDDIRRAA